MRASFCAELLRGFLCGSLLGAIIMLVVAVVRMAI